jgi:DNA-entry nuclease
MTKDEVDAENEAIIAKLSTPKKLGRKLSSLAFSDRRSASVHSRSAIKKTLAVVLTSASLWSLAACGPQQTSAASTPEPSTSTSQSTDGSYQEYYDQASQGAKSTENDITSSKAYQDAKKKLQELKSSDAYKYLKDSASYKQLEKSLEDTLSSYDQSSSDATSSSGSSSSTTSSDAQALSSWSSSVAPDYYKSTGSAVLPSTLLPSGQSDYQGLDSLGRTGYAHATLNTTMRSEAKARGRQEFDSTADDVSGLKNPVTGQSNNFKMTKTGLHGSTGYFYNKSHLIADSLGGKPTRTNLITGTRMQNVGYNGGTPGGMAYTETKARSYLDTHPNGTLAYYVQPIYQGNEIVPRGVTVDMRSSDSELNEHVIVWNYCDGYTIDYTTGAVTRN